MLKGVTTRNPWDEAGILHNNQRHDIPHLEEGVEIGGMPIGQEIAHQSIDTQTKEVKKGISKDFVRPLIDNVKLMEKDSPIGEKAILGMQDFSLQRRVVDAPKDMDLITPLASIRKL